MKIQTSILPTAKTVVPKVLHRLSKIFQPMHTIPKETKNTTQQLTSKSQNLMLELGLISPANPGSFHYLPLGLRALEKLTKLVDNAMQQIEAQKIAFATLTDVKLWKATGRFEDMNAELFKLRDRFGRNYILSPTHEESASHLLASASLSYKHLPLKMYQITSKFRDEMRPRFGLMRGREFIMKDLYSFDADASSALKTYDDICQCYDNFFEKLEIDFVKVQGDSGAMGGSISHEYHFKANVGEDSLISCLSCGHFSNKELVKENKCFKCGSLNIEVNSGIEVGHTFYLGEKYSKSLTSNYINELHKPTPLHMGSYGLGLSRILAASIEILSLENEIRWPKLLAPYTVAIISPKAGSKEEEAVTISSEMLYNQLESSLPKLKNEILLDDRNNLTIGRRFIDAKRVGYPFVIIIGQKATENPPIFEINDLEKNSRLFCNESELIKYLSNRITF